MARIASGTPTRTLRAPRRDAASSSQHMPCIRRFRLQRAPSAEEQVQQHKYQNQIEPAAAVVAPAWPRVEATTTNQQNQNNQHDNHAAESSTLASMPSACRPQLHRDGFQCALWITLRNIHAHLPGHLAEDAVRHRRPRLHGEIQCAGKEGLDYGKILP